MTRRETDGRRACWAVVVTYDRPKMLQECVEGVLAQETEVDGVVVVNNGAPFTDGRLGFDDDRLIVIEGQGNVGPAGGFALGMKAAVEAGADLLWVMNDDDAPSEEDSLCRLRQIFSSIEDEGHQLALLGCWVRRLLPDGTSFVGTRGAEWQGCLLPLQPERESDIPYEVGVTTFSGALVSGEFVREVGLPRADLFMQMEEIEYCLRSRDSGWSVWVTPEVLMTVRAHGSADGVPPWRRYYQLRNAMLVRELYGRQHSLRFWFEALRRLLYAALVADRKWCRLRLQWRGLLDGLRGRTGRLVPPEG